MKHQVTVNVEKTKHFLGITYTVTEKEHLVVDGETYRMMKQKKKPHLYQEAAAAALFLMEEEEELFDE